MNNGFLLSRITSCLSLWLDLATTSLFLFCCCLHDVRSSLVLTCSLTTFRTLLGPTLYLTILDCFCRGVIVNFLERIWGERRKRTRFFKAYFLRCSMRSFLCYPMWRSKVKGTQFTTRWEVDTGEKTFQINQFAASHGGYFLPDGGPTLGGGEMTGESICQSNILKGGPMCDVSKENSE